MSLDRDIHNANLETRKKGRIGAMIKACVLVMFGVACGMEVNLLLICLSFLISCPFWVLIAIIYSKRKQEDEKHFTFTPGSLFTTPATLTVYSRTPRILPKLSLFDNREMAVVERPDQYIYTGSTVGGVTIGSIDKIAGGPEVIHGNKTGKCSIFFKNAESLYKDIGDKEYAIVECVQLTPEDFAKAKENERLRPLTGKRRGGTAKYPRNSLCVVDIEKSTAKYLISWLAGRRN